MNLRDSADSRLASKLQNFSLLNVRPSWPAPYSGPCQDRQGSSREIIWHSWLRRLCVAKVSGWRLGNTVREFLKFHHIVPIFVLQACRDAYMRQFVFKLLFSFAAFVTAAVFFSSKAYFSKTDTGCSFLFLKKILQDPWQRFAEKDSASYVSWPKHCSKLTENVRFSYPSNISTVLVG